MLIAAGAGREIAGQHLHGGGLAGAVRAQQTEHLAATQVEVDRRALPYCPRSCGTSSRAETVSSALVVSGTDGV